MGFFEKLEFLRKSEKKLFPQKNPFFFVQKNPSKLISDSMSLNQPCIEIFDLEKSKFSSLETFLSFIYAKIYAKKFSSINIIKN
jgi:hypothetical protein